MSYSVVSPVFMEDVKSSYYQGAPFDCREKGNSVFLHAQVKRAGVDWINPFRVGDESRALQVWKAGWRGWEEITLHSSSPDAKEKREGRGYLLICCFAF